MSLGNNKRSDLKNLCPEWRKHRNKLQSRVVNKKIRQACKKEIKKELKSIKVPYYKKIPKFNIGDKVIIRAGQLIIINAEIIGIQQIFDGVLIDYALKTEDIIFGLTNYYFEEQFLFTKEETKNKIQEWLKITD